MNVQGMSGYATRAGMHPEAYVGEVPSGVASEDRSMSRALAGSPVPAAELPPAEMLAASAIHRLCQPLTALQCTLELGLDRENDPASLRGAMVDSLRECVRTIAMLTVFRDLSELPALYADVVDIDIPSVIKVLRLRCECGGTDCDARVSLDPAGLERICRSIRQVVEACGGDGQGCARVQMESGDANPASREGQQGWFCVRWSLGERSAGERSAGESGGMTESDAARWQHEIALMRPFNVLDFDFTSGVLPPLAVASTLTEAMGGMLVAGERSLELRLRRTGPARYGWHATQAGEPIPEQEPGLSVSVLDHHSVEY